MMAKRLFDIAASVCGLILASPWLLLMFDIMIALETIQTAALRRGAR